MSFLIDTDICSNYLRQPKLLFTRFLQHSGQMSISMVTLGELLAWTLRKATSPRYHVGVQDMLTAMSILPIDEPIARRFGMIRAQLLDQGQVAQPLDLFIAATAIEHNLTLVTHNTAHFAQVPGLNVVDWMSP